MIELLVSMTLVVTIMAVALLSYHLSRDLYKFGENASEQQQLVRVAFDVMSRTVRQAGMNVKPDNDLARPDEGIEAAFATAFVVRADFDRDDPAKATVPEATLAGGAFSLVSTGNDEIRGFVLSKTLPGGSIAGPDSFEFEADVAEAVRDGLTETVTVDRVALTLDDPPYTLYRIGFNEDPATFGTPAFVTRTVLAENIRSLRFRYFDRAGNEIAPPGGADTAVAIADRARISRVAIEIEALTRDPDPRYVDQADADPTTRAYRKFLLAGNVTPRNLGKRALRDRVSDVVPPSIPSTPSVYEGHCGGLYVDWPPSPPQDDVAHYLVQYGTDPGLLIQRRSSVAPGIYISGLADATDYFVAVSAIDTSGNASSLSSVTARTTANLNVPETPTNATASVNGSGQIVLGWDAAQWNASGMAGDPDSPLLRDLAGYRVYRDTSSGFTPGAGNLIADSAAVPAMAAPSFIDTQTVHCAQYHYRVSSIDQCGAESPPASELVAMSPSSDKPLIPTDVHAAQRAAGDIRVSWPPVTADEAGLPIVVDHYRIYRTPPTPSGVEPQPADFAFVGDSAAGSTEYIDLLPPAGSYYWYRVTAVDACPNESNPSEMAGATCEFNGNVIFTMPADGASVLTPQDVAVLVQNDNGTYPAMELRIYDEQSGLTTTINSTHGGPFWRYTMDDDPPEVFTTGWYTITTEVDQLVGPGVFCTSSKSIRIHFTSSGS